MPVTTIAQLRERFAEVTEEEYSDEVTQAAIDLAVQAFERAADVAFTPRTETVTLTPTSATQLLLPRSNVSEVASITGSSSGDVAVDGPIIAGYILENQSAWSTSETLTVELTHGYPETPLEVSWAVMLLARSWLIRGPSDDRRTQMPVEGGGVINLATPGMFGAEFAIPDVDRVLKQYRWQTYVA